MFKALTEHLDLFLEAGIPGYDCIVYHKGACVYRHHNGYSDRERKIPISGKEQYNIYSCTKPITCVAALQLYEKGLFQLDDDISKFLPEFKSMNVKTQAGTRKAKRQITVKDLFCMTAGFPIKRDTPMLQLCQKETEGVCATRDVMRYLAREPLEFEPGDRWEYSLCHEVLAALVEVISGMRFGEYVKDNIFDVVGMPNSTFWMEDVDARNVAAQYRYNSTTKAIEPCGKDNPLILGSAYESGGAGCVSTVDDFIKFLEALRVGNVILKSETTDLLATNQLTQTQLESFWMDNYGYGLGVRCPLGINEITDFGWHGAAGSYLMVDRSREMTLFYAQQVLGAPVSKLRTGIRQVVNAALDRL